MEPTILDYLTAIGAVVTPFILIFAGAIGWRFRNRIERLQELEAKLREERINIYFQILEPYIVAFSTAETLANDKSFKGKNRVQVVSDQILSLEYKKAAFKLSLMGSDNVVKAFNDLMQGFYNQSGDQAQVKQILLLGEFLLEIRKGVGNEKTSLDKIDMLEWLIKDIRQLRNLSN